MTAVIDNELWDELRTDIPPGPWAHLTDEKLIQSCASMAREVHDPRSMNAGARYKLKPLLAEMRLRGFDPEAEYREQFDGEGRPVR